MSVRVGSARADENGGIHGGAAGDQTGHEVETQEWYLHQKGWVVIRPKNRKVAELIALCMEWICENPLIGYDQWQDQTLYNAIKNLGFDPRKLTFAVETDCAKAVRVCICYAGTELGIAVLAACPDFYTGNEVATLMQTEQFELLTDKSYTDDWRLLKRGDILCTRTQGHTVVVLDDGGGSPMVGTYRATGNVYIRTGPGTDYPSIGILKKGQTMKVQIALTSWAFGIANGQSGYVSMKYLELMDAVDPSHMTMTATGNVYLRKGAGVLYGKLGILFKGDKVVATGETKKVLGTTWYEVTQDGVTGWASGKYLA